MIRTRTIDDRDGNPVEIEIDDGTPDDWQNAWIEKHQAELLWKYIKEADIFMPPYKPKKRKKKVERK